MTNSQGMKTILSRVALQLVPPMIRKTLLEDSSFQEEYGLETEAFLSFGDFNVSIQRSDLFNAIRAIQSGESEKHVADTNGQKWILKTISGDGELQYLGLSAGEQQIPLPTFAELSPERSVRLRLLNEGSSDVNLPSDAKNRWRNILSERALNDDEVDVFLSDFRDTPIEKARAIRNEITGGQINISTMVPHSRMYFERLVGAYNGSVSIQEYAASISRTIFDQHMMCRPYDGFLTSLFLSWHSSITAKINVDQLSGDDLVRSYDFIEKYGDRTSQVGAVEIGFRLLSTHPEIESFLIRLIKQIRDDNVNSQGSGLNLLSALIIFVDGELSRTRLFSTEPPFYRRLAALSQAALIHRQFINASVDTDQFCDWAISSRAEQYYMQSFADMRLEPRWHPDLVNAGQIKAEFIGRITNAATYYEQDIKNNELSDLVFGTKPGNLRSLRDFYYSFIPGPLEGVVDPQIVLPIDTAKIIKQQLEANEVGPSSFIALVNSALIFRVAAEQAELAARVLKRGGYRLANVENKSQLLSVLNGLATVAAVSRSNNLADELRIIVRVYRRDAQYTLSIEEVLKIYVVAASSNFELNDWREYMGDLLTELAFSDLKGDEAEALHSHFHCLLHAVPDLWVSCGKADAALDAYNSCTHLD